MFAVLFGDDADGSVFPVGIEIGGLVGDEVATANLVAKFIEGLSQRHPVARERRFSATAFARHVQDLAGIGLIAVPFLGADGVNGHARCFFVANTCLRVVWL